MHPESKSMTTIAKKMVVGQAKVSDNSRSPVIRRFGYALIVLTNILGVHNR